MSGTLWTVGVAVKRWVRGEELTEAVLWPGVLCLIVALGGLWVQARQRVVELEGREPNLRAVVELTWTMERDHPPGPPEMFLVVSIRNLGAMPSIAESWKLRLPTFDLEFWPTAIPEEYPLETPMGRLGTFRSVQSLWQKTQAPIEQGKVIRGWMRFRLEGLTSVPTGLPYDLRFTDFLGRQYVLNERVPIGMPVGPGNTPHELPIGVENPFQ